MPLDEKAYVKLDGADVLRPDDRHLQLDRRPGARGHVFVMGDNRDHSADSTVHMCQPKRDRLRARRRVRRRRPVVGKVFVLLWPREPLPAAAPPGHLRGRPRRRQ